VTLHITRPLSVIEDSGLAGLHSYQTPAKEAAIDPIRLQAARDLLINRITPDLLDPVAPAAERTPEVLRVLRAEIGRQIERGSGPLRDQPTDDASLLQLFQESLGWGPAQPYLDDEQVQEVKIVGNLILVQEEGADFVQVPERFADAGQVLDRALLLASRLNVTIDRSHPQDTLPLAHGTRMHVTIPPCTPEGTGLVCIRRGRRHAWTIDDLLLRGACNEPVAELLRLLVRAGCSFLIAGETGSGKTAWLEALVNSWPGEPHVITIEDNTLEINVRHTAWTRELVQSAQEIGAFGRAAREVLRQTPSLVAPGETRAEEAGAILAVAVSGHAVLTTIHARSAQRAVQRFGDCATMPGAYIYAGRRMHAIEDICDNFHAVIHLENSGGRRYIQELALLDGVEGSEERPCPRLINLVCSRFTQEGEPDWICAARVANNNLIWDGHDQTPGTLRRQLEQLRSHRPQRIIGTSRNSVEEILIRAHEREQPSQGLIMLNRAWAERQDPRLAAAARRSLDGAPELAAAYEPQARALAEQITAALAARHLERAAHAFSRIMADVALYAAHTPPGGWPGIEAQLNQIRQTDRQARTVLEEAQAALAQRQAHLATELLDRLSLSDLTPTTATNILRVRRVALELLHATGEVGAEALVAVDAAIRYHSAGDTISAQTNVRIGDETQITLD
jgi:pilus assembly protein CpaF